MSHPLVVHCKRAPYDVYVGRPSEWGNPFAIGRDGTREDVIQKFRHVIVSLSLEPAFMEKLVAQLRGKVLGCWCAPKPCHGDVLAEWANS